MDLESAVRALVRRLTLAMAPGRSANLMHLHDVIDAQTHVGMGSKSGHALNLAHTDHLVCDQNIFDAHFDKGFSFACLLYANANRPRVNLT